MTVESVEQNLKEIKRTERGWAGHFICSDSCKFKRNTLLECGETKVVVSTVGNYFNSRDEYEQVGLNRDYETMAFYVDPATGAYNDIDVERQIYFESSCALEIKKGDKYPDLKANEMHETVVQELTEKLQKGVTL